ncbi:hypothetical protein GAYE_SCF00G1710 [Galdieria yellowstonensis]|uniref:Elongator complex protein 5 n=1 Tax=Galdieria yellowstonensis TaxID=3028027 RepID=A0AAV9I903_9RHOD|nr:hypothetical protein GAYE_SCF00G1710 [Galdieria yellowstonensis]
MDRKSSSTQPLWENLATTATTSIPTTDVSLLQDLVHQTNRKIAITCPSASTLATLQPYVLAQLAHGRSTPSPGCCIYLCGYHPPSWVQQYAIPRHYSSATIIDLFTNPLHLRIDASASSSSSSRIIPATWNNVLQTLHHQLALLGPLPTSLTVVIENYPRIVKTKGWHCLRQLVDAPSQCQQLASNAITIVITGYPENDQYWLHRLTDLVVQVDPPKALLEHAVKYPIRSIRHLQSGNIRQEYFQWTISNTDAKSKTPVTTHLERIDSSEIATTHETEDLSKIFGDLPFKVALSEAEKARRAQVELPYVHNDVSLANSALEEHPKGLLVPSSDEDPEQDSEEDLDV